MIRTSQCPICGSESPEVLDLHFNVKMNLPTDVSIRYCSSDNFLFVANGDQESYAEYYKCLGNDSYHAELAGSDSHSPIAKLQRDKLEKLLGGFFDQSQTVLDFGCGEGWLLLELARKYPKSVFVGFDPSPAVRVGSERVQRLGLQNLKLSDLTPSNGPFDLVIASHVLEHLIEFNLLHFWKGLLAENGLLYIEVPNSLLYGTHERREFLYYFDRIHVNHFTPQSLGRLLAIHGFGHVGSFEYEFPYRDGRPYPALGMLFRKGQQATKILSQDLGQTAARYIVQENQRAKALNERLRAFDGILAWGAGDNLYRSSQNGGPLSNLPNLTILDKRAQVVTIGSRKWTTEMPSEGIRRYPWPVVITVSEGGRAICEQVMEIDPSRQVFMV